MSFARILSSSALMGSAQIVQLAAAFVRAKLTAVLLGASGVGLVGLMTTFNGNLSALAGWGLGTSGVRSIASAPPQERTGRIAAVRRLGWMLSLAGAALALVLAFLAGPWVVPGESGGTLVTLVAGLAVPCTVASGAWAAILQAGGHLRTLAKVQVTGAVVGLLVGAPLIWWLGVPGLAMSLVLAAAVPAAMLWSAARRLEPSSASVPSSSLRPLLTMGGALMLVGLLAQLSAYLIRLQLVEFEGLQAAGFYHAAFAVAGSLPGFVFVAMGADYFPRVAAAADEHEAALHAGHQIEAGLILGVPLLVLLLTAGDLVMTCLYADGFAPAVPLLTWMVWGVFLRLVSWPLGYWLLARGSAKTVIAVEAAGSLFMILLPMLLLPWFGLVGSAIAYAAAYLAYALILLVIIRRRSGRWFSPRVTAGIVSSAAMLALVQWLASSAPAWGWAAVLVTAAAAWMIARRALSHSKPS